MYPWLDMYRLFPGLRGYLIHTVDIATESLVEKLSALGFTIYTIDGLRILDEKTFFEEVARALTFPEYFGHNWDAWDECLGDFGRSLTADRVAIVWTDADRAMEADAQTFLQAVCDLFRLAMGASSLKKASPEQPKQVEVFLLGQRQGFGAQLRLGDGA